MTDQRLKSSEDQAHSSGPVTVVTDEANCGVNQKRLLCCWHVVQAWRFDSLMDRLRRGDCVNFVPLSVRYFVYWLPILHSNYWPVVRRSSASVHRLNREFVLEAALFLGGTPCPWMAKPPEQCSGQKDEEMIIYEEEIWRKFFVKNVFWASWEGPLPPLAP